MAFERRSWAFSLVAKYIGGNVWTWPIDGQNRVANSSFCYQETRMTGRSLYKDSSIFTARRLTQYLPQRRHAPNFGSRRIQHEKVSSPLFSIYKWTVLPHVNEQEQKQRVCGIPTTHTPCRNHKRHSLLNLYLLMKFVRLLYWSAYRKYHLNWSLIFYWSAIPWIGRSLRTLSWTVTGPLRLDTFRLIQQTLTVRSLLHGRREWRIN